MAVQILQKKASTMRNLKKSARFLRKTSMFLNFIAKFVEKTVTFSISLAIFQQTILIK